MKKGVFAAALLCLTLLAAPAPAQTLPGVDCFSPGLVRASEALRAGAAVNVEAGFDVENAFFARDVSVLNDMLSVVRLVYDGAGEGDAAVDRLRILADGETLVDALLTRGADGGRLTVNGAPYAVADGLIPTQEAFAEGAGALPLEAMLGYPLFERVPLASIADWLEGLEAGDALPGGLTVTRAFTVVRTMSDDGERLTRIDVDGAIAPAGDGPYEVKGNLRQPGGKAPKDTFEITAEKDRDNTFQLSYSSTRSSEITRRDKAGKNSVQTTLRSEGKLAGNRISSRLTVRLTNTWTADETGLSEKIAVSATLGHTDKTPGRQMVRLNDIAAELRATLNVSTDEESADPPVISDEATLTVKLSGNDFLGGKVKTTITIGEAETAVAGREAALSEATPSEATMWEAAPSEATPSEATLWEAAPSEATPSEATLWEAAPSEATPSEAALREATPSEATRPDAQGELSTPEDVRALMLKTARGLAKALYARLGEGARGKIESGL